MQVTDLLADLPRVDDDDDASQHATAVATLQSASIPSTLVTTIISAQPEPQCPPLIISVICLTRISTRPAIERAASSHALAGRSVFLVPKTSRPRSSSSISPQVVVHHPLRDHPLHLSLLLEDSNNDDDATRQHGSSINHNRPRRPQNLPILQHPLPKKPHNLRHRRARRHRPRDRKSPRQSRSEGVYRF